MGQISFSDAECAAKRKKTRREVFLEEMVPVVPWKAVLGLEQIGDLLHGKEQDVWADSGCRGAQSRMARDDLKWHIAGRPSDMAKSPEGLAKQRLKEQEHSKASVRAKVEHPFRVIKRQFGLAKVRFRGLAQNTGHVVTLCALSNLWMARERLMKMAGVVRPLTA